MRERGDGSITEVRNGRFWVRGPADGSGKQKSLGTFATRDEAEKTLGAALALVGNRQVSRDALIFSNFGRVVLDVRELDGFKGVAKERSRFDFHLATSLIADMHLSEIEKGGGHLMSELSRQLMRKEAADKRGRRPIDRSTVQRCMSLVSSICTEAIERGHMSMNPCTGVKVKRRKNESKNRVKFTYLSPLEQRNVWTCDHIPLAERVMMKFCWGSGIREGEFAHNFLSDLHLTGRDPHLWVRWGSRNAPPKSGKERKVRLFGDALEAAREWLDMRSSYLRLPKGTRDPGLIFPTVTGCARGKPLGNGWRDEVLPGSTPSPAATASGWVDRVKHYYSLAGVPLRPYLHWHALRHTCASSLLQGHWGRRWTLEEIRDHLGHSSIVVTQMYAHLSDDAMGDAARETHGSSYAVVTGAADGDPGIAAISCDPEGVGRAGHDPATYGLKGHPTPQRLRAVASDGLGVFGPASLDKETLAARVLQLVAAGDIARALAMAVSLAEASSPSTPVAALVRSSG